MPKLTPIFGSKKYIIAIKVENFWTKKSSAEKVIAPKTLTERNLGGKKFCPNF